MRILFLTHYFPPESNAPAIRVHEMARRWVQAGHEVTVITGVPNVPSGIIYDGYRNRLRQEETIDGVRTIRVWTYVAPNRGRVRRVLNYLSYMVSATLAALAVPKPDVLIATTPQFFCGWAGAVAARLRRVRFILEVRDLWPESIAAVGAIRSGTALRLLERLERRLYAAADHIVTVGDGYRDRLLEKGVAGERISVIPNGVDSDVFFPRDRDDAIRTRYGLGNAFVCAYIGTIGMACGLDIVLRAAEILQRQARADIRFLLVGDGAVRAELESDARARQLKNVIFAGRHPRGEIPRFYAASDACLVHLRKCDAFKAVQPSKVFESAAMACPIILGVEGRSAEWMRESGAGLCIPPGDENALLSALDRLRASPGDAAEAGRRGREFVLAHYDLDILARAYMDVVQQVEVAS